MRTKKKEVKAKLDAGGCLTYGCVSFHKWDGEYFYGRPAEVRQTRVTEAFGSFEAFWNECGHYFIYGVDYQNRTLPEPQIPEPHEGENQNERWTRIHNLKLCKCGKRIPVKQDTCYMCWRWDRLDKEHKRFVQKHTSVPLYDKLLEEGKCLLTENQKRVLKLVHHDFEGLSQTEAAEKLGIIPSAVSRTLKRIRKILPQYFPILSPLEYKVYNLHMNEGWDVPDIADYLDKTDTAIRGTLNRARKKDAQWTKARGRIQSYDALQKAYQHNNERTDNNQLDSKVKEKF